MEFLMRFLGAAMTHAFWTGGPGAYREGLQRHYDALIQNLREQIKQSADEASRSEMQTALNQAEQEYRNKLTEIRRLLF
jgi:TRAP-type C4-dicarboxylate transport system substrate-binding protein